MSLFLLALIFTVSPTEISINEKITAAIESEKPLALESIRGELLKTGVFLLIEEISYSSILTK